MASVRVRSFEHADEAQVIALWNEVFRDDPKHNEAHAMIRRKLAVQPELFLVAVTADGARVIGTVMAGYDGVRGWVHRLCVEPGQRRAGIGRQLMEAAEAALAEHDCPKLNLQVRAGNYEVIAFYESLGYAVEERASLGKHLPP
jgi:ribosomal protein S18 acetylase RimI-like enzyme